MLNKYLYMKYLMIPVLAILLLPALSTQAFAEEKRDFRKPPSPIEAAIPVWSDAVREARKYELAIERLPDLVAITEVTSNPCRINLQIRNNSHHGLSPAEWESEDDVVRLELRDILRGGLLVEDWNFTFAEIDPGRALMSPRGETLAFPWTVPGPGRWQLVLIVDFRLAIPELNETNNRSSAFSFCTE